MGVDRHIRAGPRIGDQDEPFGPGSPDRPAPGPRRECARADPWPRDREPTLGRRLRFGLGGRQGRNRGAIGERWRSGWAYVRWQPIASQARLPFAASVVVLNRRLCKRPSPSSVLAPSVSLPPKLA